MLGYFNSLRELGGSRRIVEDEVNTRLTGYVNRKRIGQKEGLFVNRTIAYEVVELTSRVPTNEVSEAKRQLASRFHDKDRVDVAIATNMISVGLDITRLGLMVVLGQPKTCAEYIQATSRVGRDPDRPGLVVTLLNIHRPRDRSHFERFEVFHQSFYRTVEATSVTPFSPRALDRGLAGTLVALSRLGHAPMTPPKGAVEILTERNALDFVVQTLSDRASSHATLEAAESEASARGSATARKTCSTPGARSPTTTRTRAPPSSTTRPRSGRRSPCCTTSSTPSSRPCTPDTRNSGRTARCAMSSRA